MLKQIKNWIEKRKDLSALKKKERTYNVVSSMFISSDYPDWNTNNESAVEIYKEARNVFKKSKEEFLSKWG